MKITFVGGTETVTGSKFLLCQLSQTDRRFQKYPPQPVVRCEGFEKQDDEEERR